MNASSFLHRRCRAGPGDRVKTNRRDADQLARLYRAGELSAIHVPDPADEAVRDFLRARYQVSRQQHRARQQLKMFLLRHNRRYGGQSSWTAAHLRYLAKIKMPFPAQQFALQELMNQISQAGERLKRYDTQIALDRRVRYFCESRDARS
jgi:transposase